MSDYQNYKLVKVPLNEINLTRMLTYHNERGFIIISACRGDNEVTANKEATERLKADIKKAGLAYAPVWGKFIENEGKPTERAVYERSFIVVNHKMDNSKLIDDPMLLKGLGMEWCKKYNQESFLYKAPGENELSHLIRSNGFIADTFNTISFAQTADLYFTSLSKSFNRAIEAKKAIKFKFQEGVIYLAKSPSNLAEAYMRYGELYYNLSEYGVKLVEDTEIQIRI